MENTRLQLASMLTFWLKPRALELSFAWARTGRDPRVVARTALAKDWRPSLSLSTPVRYCRYCCDLPLYVFCPCRVILPYIVAVTLVCDRSSFVHRLSAVGATLLPAGMERIAREQQRCPPGAHRVVSPKRYASEDSEGRPAAILSYQFQSRVKGCFLVPSLRLACVQFASPRMTALCGAPLAPLVVLAVAMGIPTRQSKILVSRSAILMSLAAFSCHQKRALMMNVVRRLHLLVSATRSHAVVLPVGAMPPQAEILAYIQTSVGATCVAVLFYGNEWNPKGLY